MRLDSITNCMKTQLSDTPTFTLYTTIEAIDRFTSLLQTGIIVPAARGVSIGAFLEALPGFTANYITEQVQTIFLNGTATDDMETPLDGDAPVLAISAAMPGLAGAIFRRNSLHAALRTVKKTMKSNSATDEITVILKLFNAIARDRGVQLLQNGVIIKAANVTAFLANRAPLMQLLLDAEVNGNQTSSSSLAHLLPTFDTIKLTFCN
ncbi:hypothetical protein SAMN02745220_04142 [Desulfopila aestuarii DSM 18488]|uniref:Uncharacterized protein n=2 Tax=Desulfopila aestuarii TaxID=231440 RepID=A0A1M7YGF5_9BACT|nr:hypothetical protein SAMN02745220_04142 [Desulfopila aestuarii DSM 18488]